MNFFEIIVILILFIVGGLPTLYLTFSAPVVIGQKIYRKIKYGTSIWD